MSIRKELEDKIRAGKTVTYRGSFYSTIADLPSEAELAKGDKAQEEAARQNIKAELARLSSQLDLLNEGKPTAAPVVDSVAPASGTISSETPEGKAALDKLDELGEGQNAEIGTAPPVASKDSPVAAESKAPAKKVADKADEK